MLKQFVFVDKLISYEYFMDELKDYELELLLEAHDECDKASWEQTRLLMYSFLAPYQKKGSNTRPVDVLPLPWDGKHQDLEEHNTEITNQQIEILRAKSEALIKKGVIPKKSNQTSTNG